MDFWEIYDQYSPRVRRFILSLVRDEWVADDLNQETFARVQASLTSLRDPAQDLVVDISYRVQSVP